MEGIPLVSVKMLVKISFCRSLKETGDLFRYVELLNDGLLKAARGETTTPARTFHWGKKPNK